jgi:hypothetical protein
MANGGKRVGAGRKSKIDELDLIQAMDAYYDPYMWAEKLVGLINCNEKNISLQSLKLYAEYRFGKAKQQVDITSLGKEFKGISPIEWVKNGKDK